MPAVASTQKGAEVEGGREKETGTPLRLFLQRVRPLSAQVLGVENFENDLLEQSSHGVKSRRGGENSFDPYQKKNGDSDRLPRFLNYCRGREEEEGREEEPACFLLLLPGKMWVWAARE